MNYSINQFFAEAHTLVKKYEIKNVLVKCSFDVADSVSGPKLTFHINIYPSDKEEDMFPPCIASGYGHTPDWCLCHFEDKLIELTNQIYLKRNYVAVLPDAHLVEEL